MIHGSWKMTEADGAKLSDEESMVFIFNEDGTCSSVKPDGRRDEGDYKLSDDQKTLSILEGGEVVVAFGVKELTDTRLVVEMGPEVGVFEKQ